MALPAQDTFTGTDGTALTIYSASWTYNAGTFAINSNSVNSSSSTETGAHWNADTFGNDQYAQGVITAHTGSVYIGPAVRCAASGATYYGYYCNQYDSYLFVNNGGTWTQIGSTGGVFAVNDVVYVEASGTTITAKKNGSTTGTPGARTNNALASGYAGISGYGSGATRLDNWEGGNLGSAGATGTLSATQASNTISAAGTVTVIGSSTLTQATQTISSAGTVGVVGTLTATQAANTLAAAGTVAVAGVAALTQVAQTSAAAGFVTDVSDIFAASDGTSLSTYSANWTANFGAFAINSGGANADSASAISMAHWEANTFVADQYAQAKIAAIGADSSIGVAVRCAAGTTATGYVFYSDQFLSYLFKYVAGSFTQIGGAGQAFQVGDVVRLEVAGTTLRPLINGSLWNQGEQSDSSIASGYPGIGGYGNSTGSRLDEWGAVGVIAQTTGSLSATQASNTLAATGTVEIVGAATLTQAAQTLAASGTVAITGTLTATQDANTLGAAGTLAIMGAAALSQAGDTVTTAGVVAVVGTATLTQAGDTIVSAAAVAIVGTLTTTQAGDTLSATGVVAVVGTLTATQDANTLAAAAGSGTFGAATLTQADQTASAAGTVAVSGSAALVQAGQTVVAAGVIAVTGAAVITQAGNTLAGAVQVAIVGAAAMMQVANTLAATGYLDLPSEITGSLDATQDGNTLVAAGVVMWLYVFGRVTGPGASGNVSGPRERAI